MGTGGPGTADSPTSRSYWVVEGQLLAGAYPWQSEPTQGVGT